MSVLRNACYLRIQCSDWLACFTCHMIASHDLSVTMETIYIYFYVVRTPLILWLLCGWTGWYNLLINGDWNGTKCIFDAHFNTLSSYKVASSLICIPLQIHGLLCTLFCYLKIIRERKRNCINILRATTTTATTTTTGQIYRLNDTF